ncbi:Alpha-1,3-mannosyl-glycoprotein 2-beta-N-acetylglucosaminyltransferase [Halotydeus destructor]|nr:Alpha-1,3-mannosyl-glycoprotein 2-beta-N-acetylglucosaminyltransferase [Halotydeus destructor]
MRKKTFYAIGSISFLCWIFVLSYLFVHKPNQKHTKVLNIAEVNREIEVLERELKEQINSNDGLLQSLRNIKRQIELTGKDINEVVKENPSLLSARDATDHPIIAVLVFACNRVTVKRNIDQLLKYRPEHMLNIFPIIVSQDCRHEATKKVILSYGDKLKLIEQPDQSDFPLTGKEKKFKGYYKISRHYGWALNTTFKDYDAVLIVEDDLDISPDFFEYFRALYPILKKDPTIWCVSAWNDNGKEALVANEPELLYRSDFFPGLGWMLTKDVWNELAVKWPKAFWDDWIRQPGQRKGRVCIRPEISRSKTFGKIGVSNGLFFEKHLKFIKLNDQSVPFTKMNMTYLLKENYDVAFLKKVYGTAVVTVQELVKGDLEEGPLRLTYRSRESYKKTCKTLGLMDDLKSGVPRTGYRGVVSFMHKRRRVYLAPPPDWRGYDVSWT